MADEKKVETLPNGDTVETVVEEEYRKPNPQDNPRNISLGEIAKTVAKQHVADAAETMPTMDEDGNISPAPASPAAASEAEPPAAAEPTSPPVEAEPAAAAEPPAGEPAPEAIDPAKEYEVTVHGQKMKVPGKTIIDAGISTLQKGAEADFRLKVASQLLEEAERRAGTTPQGRDPAPALVSESTKTEAELSNMLQFGTPEQAAEAVRLLLAGGATPEKISGLAAQAARIAAKDEVEFQAAKQYLQREFNDVLSKEPLRNLFFSEETRLRQAGDRRPYAVLYKAIGESIRKDFNLTKPAAAPAASQPAPGTAAARQVAKAAAPAVPRTAAARLQEAPGGKVKTSSEIIAQMAASRGKDRLAPQPKGT